MIRDARRPSRNVRTPPRRVWQYSLFSLFVLTTVCAVLLKTGTAFPTETLIVAGIVAGAALAIALYVGELVVIGWFLDFPMWLAERALPAAYVPLTIEHAGPIAVVTLSDNIASTRECRSVQQQLQRLIAEHHCDLIVDFSSIKKLTSRFRGVLDQVARAARAEAEKQGQSCGRIELPPGETFRLFDDRRAAIAEMGPREEHGWVVLCAVPVGIRAI